MYQWRLASDQEAFASAPPLQATRRASSPSHRDRKSLGSTLTYGSTAEMTKEFTAGILRDPYVVYLALAPRARFRSSTAGW